MKPRPQGCLAAAAVLLMVGTAQAVVIGTLDTFQDLTEMGWRGASPLNINTGGPAGAGDAYLQGMSSGGSGPDSRMAIYSLDERWTGDYLAAGVTSVETDIANFGTIPFQMRIVLFSAGGSRYTSTNSLNVAADGLWHHESFSLDSAALTRVLGSDTYPQCLSSVVNLMFRHDAGTPSSGGTPIAATAGFDNVLAVPAPGGTLVLAFAAAAARRRRR